MCAMLKRKVVEPGERKETPTKKRKTEDSDTELLRKSGFDISTWNSLTQGKKVNLPSYVSNTDKRSRL
jgi:hypothetical protein